MCSSKSAFMSRIKTLSYQNNNVECILPEEFLNETIAPFQSEVKSFLKANIALKFNIELHAIYTKSNIYLFENPSLQLNIFKTDMVEVFFIEDFPKTYSTQVINIIRKTEEFQAIQSGWTLLQLVKVDMNLNKYQPLKGSSYIPLPKTIVARRACVNVKNKDDFCFKWSILSAFYENISHSDRPSAYNVDIASNVIEINGFNLDFRGLRFPLNVRDVSIFEDNNPRLSVTVFGYDKQNDLVIGPYYKTKKKKTKHINLMYIEEDIQQKTLAHYVWIKSFSRLVSTQLNSSNGKITPCDSCLQHFYGKEAENHHEVCGQREEDIFVPDISSLMFRNYVKTADVPFVIYSSLDLKTCNEMQHIYTYFVKCSYNNDLNKWRTFKGINAQRLFLESLINDAKYFYYNYSSNIAKKVSLTREENSSYEKNNYCCICSKTIAEDKVKLHCRLSGKYRGPAHHACALNYKVPKKFPVVFQNLYYNDYVSFINEMSNIDDNPITVKSLNNDSTLSFTKDVPLDAGGKLELRFLNFYSFIPFSLYDLVQNMSKNDFKIINSTYPDDENKFNLAIRKNILPSNYVNSAEELSEACLPNIDGFYNTLTKKKCSPENYAHAKTVWNEFGCQTIEDYLILCLKNNVLVLSDVFENFRLIYKNAYNLDPCHYFTASELSWDAMLKLTGVKLKTIADKSMYSFFQNGMRGGTSQCFDRHSTANNRYLSDYNNKLPSKYIINFHANDFYARIMSESMPYGNFEWETDIENFSLDSIQDDSKTGYVLEVDLEYPTEIHKVHKSLPFCSEYTIYPETNVKKLNVNLNHKYNYVIYYKNLKQCLKHGLKLKKIHRILKFNQSDWLKKFITLNKTYEANAKSRFEIYVYKIINDAFYEKIMGKAEKKIKILQKWENEHNKLGARAFIIKPDFSSVSIFNENIVAIELHVNQYRYMPIYLEFVISELAKWKTYNFHYEYMIPKYETNMQLNYIDTDSLIYTIETSDFYNDIANDIYLMFNKSDHYATNSSHLKLKTLGIMKDAAGGVVIKEFMGLRSKLYFLKTESISEISDSNGLQNDFFTIYNSLIYEDKESLKWKLYQSYAKLIN